MPARDARGRFTKGGGGGATQEVVTVFRAEGLGDITGAFEAIKNKLEALKNFSETIGLTKAIGEIQDIESIKASLQGVMGTTEGLNRKWSELKKITSTTPFQIGQVAQAFTRLTQLGLDASERTIKAFGDIASSMPGKEIGDFTEAVADAVGGEMERLKEFGIKAKKEGDDVTLTFADMSLKVRNDAGSIQEALTQIAEAKFGGAMEAQMNTLGGVFSNLQDRFTFFAEDLGEGGLSAGIKAVVSAFTDLGGEGESIGKMLGGVLGKALEGIAKMLPLVKPGIDLVVTGFKLLSPAIDLVVKLIEPLIAGFRKVQEFMQELGDAVFGPLVDKLTGVQEEIERTKNSFEGLSKVMEEGGVRAQDYNKAHDILAQAMQKQRDGGIAVIEAFQEIRNAVYEGTLTYEEAEIAIMDVEEALGRQRIELHRSWEKNGEWTEEQLKSVEAIEEFNKGLAGQMVALENIGKKYEEKTEFLTKLAAAQRKAAFLLEKSQEEDIKKGEEERKRREQAARKAAADRAKERKEIEKHAHILAGQIHEIPHHWAIASTMLRREAYEINNAIADSVRTGMDDLIESGLRGFDMIKEASAAALSGDFSGKFDGMWGDPEERNKVYEDFAALSIIVGGTQQAVSEFVQSLDGSLDPGVQVAQTIDSITNALIPATEAVMAFAEAQEWSAETSMAVIGGAVRAGNAITGSLIKDEKKLALVRGAMETAAAIAAGVMGDVPGAIGHGLAAAKYFAVAGGTGGSSAKSKAAQESKKAKEKEERRASTTSLSQGRNTQRSTMQSTQNFFYQFGDGGTGRALIDAVNTEARRRTGAGFEPGVVNERGHRGQ